MYHYQIGISVKEYDNFVKNHPQVNLLQSSSWAKIKDNWDNERIGFYQNNKLVAAASILIKSLPFGTTIFYIPRGPIMNYTEARLVTFVMNTLQKISKSRRSLFIKFDPMIPLKTSKNLKEYNDSLEAIKILKQAGAIWKGRTQRINENIQPRFQATIYAHNFKFELLPKSTKQSIRTARNKGIQVQFGQLELLEEFSVLTKKTEKRKRIHLRDRKYYQKLLENYPDASYITLSSLDIPKRIETLENKMKQLETDATTFTRKTKTTQETNNNQEKHNISRELNFLQKKVQAGVKRAPLSGTLSLEFGKTSENIYAGMDEEFRHYQATILTWYETAMHAFDRGMIQQNMGGVENNLNGGLYHFKSKFNPVIEEFIGEFNLPTSPFYRLFDLSYHLHKKLRS